MVGRDVALGNRKAAFSGAHLNSVIGNAQSDIETESLAEPFRCCARIRVAEDGNHWARRNGAVVAHRYIPKKICAQTSTIGLALSSDELLRRVDCGLTVVSLSELAQPSCSQRLHERHTDRLSAFDPRASRRPRLLPGSGPTSVVFISPLCAFFCAVLATAHLAARLK